MLRSHKFLSSLAAVALVASSSIAVDGVANAADQSPRASLDAAIAATNIAYSEGVSSVHTSTYLTDTGDETTKISKYGVTGAGLYGDSPSVDLAWETTDGATNTAFAADSDADGVVLEYTPLKQVFESYRFLPRVRTAVVEDVKSRGGTLASLVPVYVSEPASFWRVDSVLESANPAYALQRILGDYSQSTVSVGSGGNEPSFIVAFSMADEIDAALDVFLNSDGHIREIHQTLAVAGSESATVTAQVVAVGGAVDVPPAVQSRVNTPLVRQGIYYSLSSSLLKSSLAAAARVASALAAIDGKKVNVTHIRTGLKDAGVLKDGSYVVTRQGKGYRVREQDAPGSGSFGEVCMSIAAAGKLVKVRYC